MKVLFFAPHSAIWVHAFPEALIAEALQQSGHEVVYVTCGEVLDEQCVAMNAFGLNHQSPLADRKRICDRCNANKGILRQTMRLRGCDMADALQPEDRVEIDRILSSLNPANYLDLQIDGIPIGRYSLYELILGRKKNDLGLNDEEWREYRTAVRGALFAFFAGRRLLQREQPERVVTYNSLYSVHRVFARLAESRGIPSYFLHAGSNLSRRLQTLWMGRDYTFRYAKNLIAEWPRFRNQPCPPELIDQATAHMLVLFGGRSIFGYSSSGGRQTVDIRSRFGIRADQRLLVATMSSPDERFAAQTIDALPGDEDLIFPKQVDWIQALTKFVASRPDLFLLIRVHPREFPNKREHVQSRNATLLAEAFESLPANAAVNWPTDDVALYDLANCTDVFLNAWSSAGKEMALLGVPVVTYSDELIFYPPDLNYTGETLDDFFRNIERALADGWSIERSRLVYRWLALEQSYAAIDIADSYAEREHASRNLADRVLHRLRSSFDADYIQKSDCKHRAARLKERSVIEKMITSAAHTPVDASVQRSIPAGNMKAEDEALRAALSRIGSVLLKNGSPDKRSLAHKLANLSLPLAAAA